MIFNIYQIIILFGIIQGVIYAGILFFFKPIESYSNRLLGFLIICVVANLFQYWLYDVGIISRRILELIFLPWQFYIPSVFLLYWEQLGTQQKHRHSAFLNYIFYPGYLFITIHIYLKLSMIYEGVYAWEKPEWVSIFYFLEEVITIIYGVIVCMYMMYHRQHFNVDMKSYRKGIIKWLKYLIYTAVGICGIWFISHIVLHYSTSSMEIYYLMWIILSIVVSFLGIPGIYYSYILQHEVKLNVHADISMNKVTKDTVGMQQHFKNLKNLIEDKDILTDSKLDLKCLANYMEMSPGYVSKLINTYSSKHFNEFINDYRIDYVKMIMNDPKYRGYNVMGYGYEAGFNSKSTFYKAFRQCEKMSPGEYLKKSRADETCALVKSY